MPITVVTLLFIATAPIGLLPAILALFQKARNAGWVALANALVWISVPFAPSIRIPGVSVAVILVVWLFLLRFALTESRLPSDAAEPARSENTRTGAP
jgi:uncharacterized protein YhhL (DUF1145 family)